MSSAPRADARPKTPKGSVKAARERAEAGLPLERPPHPSLPRPTGSPKNMTISRPTPMPQWPLSGSSGDTSPENERVSPPNESPDGSSPNSSGSPPRRPKRPSNVPSILDASKIQDHTPAFQYRQQQARNSQQYDQNGQQTRYWDPGYVPSPNEPTTPGTGLSGASASSRPSTTSSFGSIPDFPVPAVPAPPPQSPPQAQIRRSIGPPPSARRGASSYYSQTSVVAPIPEEALESPNQRQHGSYASSHVIPKSWADGPPEYYMTSYTEEDEEEDDGSESRESKSTDPDENTGLVRKASLGRQYKPSLTTVRSNGDLRNEDGAPREARSKPLGAAGAIAAAAGAASISKPVTKSNSPKSRQNPLASNAFVDPTDEGFYDASTEAMPKARLGTNTPGGPPQDPRIRQVLGGLERGGAIDYPEETPPMDTRRPPPLNIEAVREAESRGSMTSLPDLIRRATRLASNLDKGRTASRLGMLEMFNSSDPNMLARAQAANGQNQTRNSSLSGMLSSFPAPAMTPTQDRMDGQFPAYDGSNRDLITPMSPMKPEGRPKRRKRFCGMPLWVFTILFIVLILVVAAAVVIPIVLIVLPRNSAAAAAAPVDFSQCPIFNPCSNGGTSVVSANACQCVCANKFTGSTCAAANDGSCTTTNLGSFKSATIGDSLVGAISSASKFQVPLNETSLLATLAASNITCASENALVSFVGQTRRRAIEKAVELKVRLPEPQAITSNGIVLASPTAAIPTAATVSGTATSSATPTSTFPSASDQAFAGAAVLWVLQQSQNLNTAALAQSALLASFNKGGNPSSVDLGEGVAVDFSKHQIMANGTAIAGS